MLLVEMTETIPRIRMWVWIPTWKAVPRNKHTGRFPYKSPRDVATLLLSPSQHQEDWDEVSLGEGVTGW